MNQNDILNLMMSRCGNNPMARNVMEMMRKGDMNGIEQMARNMCAEKGTTPQEVMQKIRTMFNLTNCN